MSDAKFEDAKCFGIGKPGFFAGLAAAIKGKLGLAGKPIEPKDVKQLAEFIREELEATAGKPVKLIWADVPLANCTCLACRQRAAAPWN